MSELTIGNTIKVILGLLVIIAVIAGLYFLFKERVIDFFKNLPGGNSTNLTKMLLIPIN